MPDERAYGETVRPVVAVVHVRVATVEVQVVRVARAVRRNRPVVAVTAEVRDRRGNKLRQGTKPFLAL